MTLLEQFPRFRASADTVPSQTLLQQPPELSPSREIDVRNSYPFLLRLHGIKLATIQAVGHPLKSMVCPYKYSQYRDKEPEPRRDDANPSPPSPDEEAVELSTVFHHLLDPSGYTGMWSHPGLSNKHDGMGPDVRNIIFADHVEAHANYFPDAAPAVDALRPRATRGPAHAAQTTVTVAQPDTAGQAADKRYYERVAQRGELPACIGQCFFVASAVGVEEKEEEEGNNCVWGLCPWTVTDGDVVAVLLSGKVPMVLRPVQLPEVEEGEKPSEHYELIGECFVDRERVMNEAWMRNMMTDEKLETFVLV
jgi:hypothetical protein